ncbi:2-hydroxyacid dehydrogenase [Mycobacterium sp.]|jgi:lactate dehydrogenase-like 2-hydroxyacid dehydrogenase|uniref:2-hydroxyacid dehydrogenase n=1 Tax=Mycobacterium sp. TaxID=1785 RepID=UPI002D6719D8|nr:2-hydroxyacid dehydrogenase [Mycobacterium sp.]HZA10730.1 2-hydroxyacid dehydrogenase [Mycobacterium sp.]
MRVLQVGELDPGLAETLALKYDALVLPADESRTAFLSRHAPQVRAIVEAGQPVDAALMNALPNLGAIIHYGAGYDTVDVDTAHRLGIGVSNTPDVLTDSVADTAVALTLTTMRGFCAADRYVRAGRWPVDGPYRLTRDVSRSRVGILGLGRIGSAIARRLVAFDCVIAYHNRHELPRCRYRYASSPVELAQTVDVLVVAATGGSDTEKLVGRDVLETLGPQGFLINVARGSIVDQNALVELLSSGRLAGAGLDVFANEPDVPTELRTLDNVVVLPHVGSATARTRSAMAALVLQNLDEYLTNDTLATPVVEPIR